MKRFGERRALLRIIGVWAITAVALHGFAPGTSSGPMAFRTPPTSW